eukprot:2307004-Amphidinium_carterae.2
MHRTLMLFRFDGDYASILRLSHATGYLDLIVVRVVVFQDVLHSHSVKAWRSEPRSTKWTRDVLRVATKNSERS